MQARAVLRPDAMESPVLPIALVVGFADALARACAARLETAGFVVVRAAHGLAAQEEAARLAPALILVSPSLFSMEKSAVATAATRIAACVVEASSVRDVDGALLRLAS